MSRAGGPLSIVIDVRRLKDFGIGTHIRNLVNALARLDSENRYHLVCRPEDHHEFSHLPENFRPAAYRRPETDPLEHIAFSLFVGRFAADLYHIPLNRVPLWMRKPYVVTVHDLSRLLFGGLTGARRQPAIYRARRGLVNATKVIAVSSATRRDVEMLFGIPTEKIRVIFDAPDPKFLAPSHPADARAAGPGAVLHERHRILERYQIDHPFVLYAGSIRRHKNIPRLIEAFSVVRGELTNDPLYSELRLILIGDEISKLPEVRRTVIQSRVEPFVRFFGFVPLDTLRVFYESAVVFAFPSLYEGFGLPPLEAMACGTPVVTSNTSSLVEAVGDAAILVNPENVFDIARGIRDLLRDDALRVRLVEKGRRQAQRFSWERTAHEVLATYLEVAGR